MIFRIAKKEDIEKIMPIIEKAQEYLKNQGIDQWQDGYPNEESIGEDIEAENFYILEENDKILGVTALIFGEDKTYQKIYDGKWLTNGTYGVIHRLAVGHNQRRRGIANKILKEVEKTTIEKNINSIKVDTHRDNKGMQKLLEKNGYQYCGIIYARDNTERVAFEKILDKKESTE